MKALMVILLCLGLVACGGGASSSSTAGTGGQAPGNDEPVDPPVIFASIEELGEALFHDPNLSFNRTQSCAVCHNPNH